MANGQRPTQWRMALGIVLFVVSISWPVLIPILPLLGVSASATAAFSGVMVVVGEGLMLLGVAVAGKEGFAMIKAKAFGLLKAHGPPREVSKLRYTVGLVMFVCSLVLGWAAPYVGHHLPSYESHAWVYAAVFDVILVVSLFVLGAGFWDKLHALFRHDARAMIPRAAS